MITQSTIDRLRDLQLSDVISKYSIDKWKRSTGNSYTGCCPFHSEKSPSFVVNDTKQIYKCFGCGAGGNNAISFVMAVENKSFYEACIHLCTLAGIEPEFETRELTEKQKIELSDADQQEQVLNYVIPVYQLELQKLPADHPAKLWLTERNIDDNEIAKWQIGWAPAEWRFITEDLVAKNWFDPASKLGIIKRNADKDANYDGYRSRIIFPITDRNGRFIGMGGRYIRVNESDAEEIPKYINPAECAIYNKSAVLFGLSVASKSIQKENLVYVTEGYMDVVSPHLVGIENTVSTCGTAFTEKQFDLLKRHTSKLVLWRDTDQAGKTSTFKSIPMALSKGFEVQVAVYEEKDPDEYCRKWDVAPKRTDAIDWYASQMMEHAGESITEKAVAKQEILKMLAYIQNDIIRNNYLDHIIKKFKWKAADTKREFAGIEEVTSAGEATDEEGSTIKWASWMSEQDKEAVMNAGFLAVNRKVNGKPICGYYSFNATGKVEITNFTIQPLFHVYAGVESRFLLEVNNGYRKSVLDIPAKAIPSVDQFQSYTVAEGNFLIFGAKAQWLRIASDLLPKFPRCIEVNHLGWQSFGFFAFVDKVYVPGSGLHDLDNWGIYKHQDEHFLVPASCEAYSQLQRTGGDPYEHQRYLSHKQSKITFSQWTEQMCKVYLEKGPVGVAYAILTLYRDIIFNIDNNCPHLYAFGEPSSGKSKWAESITALFYFKRPAFNLNSGTDFAFFMYMQQYVNCPSHLNEFEIEVIKPEWFQAIKGVFDGESRQRGKGGSKSAVEIMKVQSTLVLTGQKLVTADDNSVVTRSLIEPFSTRDDINEQEKKDYDTLKQWESQGLSGILPELLSHRATFEKHYKSMFDGLLSKWRKSRTETRNLNQRIVQNWAHLSSCFTLMASSLNISYSHQEFEEYCFKQAVRWSSFIRSSDTLSEFWRTLEYLVDQQQVIEGWDYIVQELGSVKIRVGDAGEKLIEFNNMTKVMFIRLNSIHKLFQQAYRSRTGKEAMNMENLLHYFSSRKYYLGSVKSKKFHRYELISTEVTRKPDVPGYSPVTVVNTDKQRVEKISSCYVFLYDEIGIDIIKNQYANEAEPSLF